MSLLNPWDILDGDAPLRERLRVIGVVVVTAPLGLAAFVAALIGEWRARRAWRRRWR